MLIKSTARFIVHKLGKAREYQNSRVKVFAKNVKNKRILEIGSGKKVQGKYSYSLENLFDKSNDFLKTDINKDFGHKVLDVTKMNFNKEFDVIVCMNVLEHVYDFQGAISNMHRALKKDGTLILAVPTFYPLHDEPGDYWRFTEHALRIMLKDFVITKLDFKGLRALPTTYYIEAKK